MVFRSHAILRLALIFPVAFLSFGGVRLAVRLRRAFEVDALEHVHWVVWLFAHWLSLAGFFRLTWFICEGDLAASPHAGAWVLACLTLGLATGATWLAALLPPGTWLRIAIRSRRELVMSGVVSVAACWISGFGNRFWESMAGLTLRLVRGMLVLVARDVTFDPEFYRVGVDGFVVRIAHGCSGFEGIGLVVAFLAAYIWWFRGSLRWPMAYLLLPVGAVTIWVFNAVRITSLVLIGAWVSPNVALGGFHSQAGWIAFLGVGLGLVALSRRSSFFAADLANPREPATSNPSLSLLGPFLTIVATAMVTGAFSSGFDAFYGLRVLTGGLALWYFRRDFAGLLRGWSWEAVAIGAVAFALWMALEPARPEGARSFTSGLEGLSRGEAWAWVALRVIGSVAIVPLAEELAFRGYLTRRLISIDFESVPVGKFSWASLLISSAAFGMLHGRWLAGMVVGVLYALALYRKGRLGDAVLAHAVTNLFIAVTVLASGDWTLWS